MSTAEELIAALLALAPAASVVSCETTPWCSATFAGERHEVLLAFTDRDVARRFSVGLPDHLFELPGRLVADIFAEAPAGLDGAVYISVEALTIEEA
ncbi:MAG TPA: hypothetical protein VEZ48_06725 [Sphingomonadaceae bacterium]|jgi:hypothetical protein|nr:hypothetical protein [Sphingomonadaceae bacterium]